MSICSVCGSNNPDSFAFCSICGSQLPQMQVPNQPNYYEQQQNQYVNTNQTGYQAQNDYQSQMGYQPQPDYQNGYYNQGFNYNQIPNVANNGPIRMPDLNEPMTFKEWFFPLLILLIPIANVIFLVIWGFFGNEKKSKVSFARAALAAVPIYLIVYYILIAVVSTMNY